MNRIIAVFLTVAVLLATASCRTDTSTQPSVATPTVQRIPLQKKIDKVISMGPSNTEILIALGFADKIIAVDAYSNGLEGLAPGIPLFNMMAPDVEQMIFLEPDVIFITGMSAVGGIDPFMAVSDVGISVISIPTSENIAGIKADIRLIATVMGVAEKGDEIVAEMEQTIDAIATIGETITDKKTVYFEISAAPHLYSFGKGVFLNEMLEMIGAKNILADRNQWTAVSEEAVLARNPDVIFTNVDHSDDPAAEIMSRPGWEALTAVQNRNVYYIDATTSSRPNHHIVKALREMAKAAYPDKY